MEGEKKKASEAVKEAEVQKHKKEVKVALDVDKENAVDSADGKAMEVADDDDSESDDSECDDSDNDDGNDNDKFCTCDHCWCTLGNWKAAKDQNSKYKLIGCNIK